MKRAEASTAACPLLKPALAVGLEGLHQHPPGGEEALLPAGLC